MEAQFKIGGNQLGTRFWGWLRDLSQKRLNQSTEKIINVSNVLFPTANVMIVKYEIINLSQKYEIVIQGDYQSAFRYMKDNNQLMPDINIEAIVTDNHNKARLITLSK